MQTIHFDIITTIRIHTLKHTDTTVETLENDVKACAKQRQAKPSKMR